MISASKTQLNNLTLSGLFYFFVSVILSCNDSGKTKDDSLKTNVDSGSVADKRSYDTANTTVYIDTTNLPIALMDSRHNLQKEDSAKFNKATSADPLQILFYTGENFTGESMAYTAGSHNTSELGKFLASGIRSIKLPFGLCADILYNTKVEIFENGGARDSHQRLVFAGKNLMKTVSVNVNQYYSPGDYPQIDHKFLKPALVTIYPWTDFYFSTDDPAVPGAIQEIFVGASSDENGKTRPTGSISFNDRTKVYTKHFAYHIPEGKKLNIWESTKNGESSSWSNRITDKGDSIYLGLRLTIRSLVGTRNWIGVRASAVPK